MIDRQHDLPITKQAEVLCISRGSVPVRNEDVQREGRFVAQRALIRSVALSGAREAVKGRDFEQETLAN